MSYNIQRATFLGGCLREFSWERPKKLVQFHVTHCPTVVLGIVVVGKDWESSTTKLDPFSAEERNEKHVDNTFKPLSRGPNFPSILAQRKRFVRRV